MKIDIEYKTKNETLTIHGKGLLLLPFINFGFKTHHDFIEHKIKLDNKLFGGSKIIKYYPPEYIKENDTIEKDNNQLKTILNYKKGVKLK